MDIAERIVAALEPFAVPGELDVMGPYQEGIKKVRDLYRVAIMVRGESFRENKEYIYTSWILHKRDCKLTWIPFNRRQYGIRNY